MKLRTREASHATALLVLAFLTRRLARNLRFLRFAERQAQLPVETPRVSVLVPARNEARTIVACIESLAAQRYPDYEVIVLNDQSSDGTGALLDTLAAWYPHVRVVHAANDPPAGWNGKSYACQRLAALATGDWLLFTDADTWHTPDSIARGIAQATALDVDLLSAFTRQVTVGWAERVLVSFVMDFLPLIGLDLTALWQQPNANTAAIGQYMLVRAAPYRAAGGHGAVFDALVDDFALAKHLKTQGHRIAVVDGTAMVSCRMYRSAREVWSGFTRSVLLGLETAGTDRRPWWWAPAFAWGYASVFVLPFVRLLTGQQVGLALVELGWLAALRGAVNRRLGRPMPEVLATPLAAWSVMALALSAGLRRLRGGAIRWKGRDYAVR